LAEGVKSNADAVALLRTEFDAAMLLVAAQAATIANLTLAEQTKPRVVFDSKGVFVGVNLGGTFLGSLSYDGTASAEWKAAFQAEKFRVVDGSLLITQCNAANACDDLTHFDAVQAVTGAVYVGANGAGLTKLDGAFKGLVAAGGAVSINSNSGLVSANGTFPALVHAKAMVSIGNNDNAGFTALTSAFPKLTTVGGLSIKDNDHLTALTSAFPSLTAAGGLQISSNDHLANTAPPLVRWSRLVLMGLRSATAPG
jgi:hypothetical protein